MDNRDEDDQDFQNEVTLIKPKLFQPNEQQDDDGFEGQDAGEDLDADNRSDHQQEKKGQIHHDGSPGNQDHQKGVHYNEEHKEFQTPDHDQQLTQDSELDSKGKKTQKQANPFATGKNFIKDNKKVKTVKEMQLENSEKKKVRMSQVNQRKSTTSWMLSRVQQPKDDNTRLSEWGSVNLKNNILDRQPNTVAYTSNKSNGFITKVDEPSQANALGKMYSQSKQQNSWQKTNASNINLLRSYKTLDMPEKNESNLVSEVLAKVDVKHNINLKSKLDQHNYVRKDGIPEDYKSYQNKDPIVHNVNNSYVQNMRVKTFTSNIF